MPYADPDQERAFRKRRYERLKADPARCDEKRAKERERYRRLMATPEGAASIRARTVKWMRSNPDKVSAYSRRSSLKRLYRISETEYDALFAHQGGACAICRRPPSSKRLAVDHCHKTNRVRGLLCDNCNHALGKLHDSPELMRAAAKYLEAHLV
jgi:hypothetical protein